MTFDANNSVSRAAARGDLRIRLNEISEREFRDEELDRWLNLGQYDTWLSLKEITSIWYGERDSSVTILAYKATLPTNCSEVKKVRISNTFVPIVDYREYEGFAGNSLYSAIDFCCHRGQQLLFTNSDTGTADVYYIAKPTEMTSDSDYIQVVEEFHDLVIMFAQTKAMQKLGLGEQRQATEKDIASRVNAIRNAYMSEMQMEEYRKQLRTQGR